MDEADKTIKRSSEKTVVVRYSSTNEMDAKNAMRMIIEAHSEEENNVYPEAL